MYAIKYKATYSSSKFSNFKKITQAEKVGQVQNMKVWPKINSVCKYGTCTMNTVLNIGNFKQNHSSGKSRSSSNLWKFDSRCIQYASWVNILRILWSLSHV